MEVKKILLVRVGFLVAGLGFEPRQTESESVVLPLHNPASTAIIISLNNAVVKGLFKKAWFIIIPLTIRTLLS